VIRKQDILARAAEWGLRADIVEKDYALGWLLAAIARHPETARSWVFKGGTCLKKCFIETYRFSEDLDFSLRYWGSSYGPALESIRFAGANRLLVEFEYNQKHRVVEPYSLRRSRAGNVLLYAWELTAGHIKAFDLGKSSNLRVASNRFQPRYAVQLGVGSAAVIPPVVRRPNELSMLSNRKGPAYAYECLLCRRRFPHKKRDSALRRHNDEQGARCSSRRGRFVETLY